jgi:DNA-binding transcriptional ArsR family regulator
MTQTPELEARRRASGIVAQMFMKCLQAMMGDLAEANFLDTLPELLIAMVVRLNDGRDEPPISISEISRLTGISRATVRRHVERLIERGVVIRKDDGIVGDDAYLFDRIDAPYFKTIVATIIETAELLRENGSK